MKVGKRRMCRICLVEHVRMYVVTNKDMQNLYEKLTDTPFVTGDSRPILTCVFCCTKLKQCCQLQRKCVEAEKLFTQMLREDDETKPPIQKGLLEFIISPTEQFSVIGKTQLDTVEIKVELPDYCDGHNDINEIKIEQQTESGYLDSYPVIDGITTNHSESDSDDDKPLMEFKSEVEEKSRVRETQSAPTAEKPELYVELMKLEDTITAKKTEQPDSPIIRDIQKPTFTASSCARAFLGVKKIATSKNDLTNSKSINKHTHTGEKPYKCDICQKRYRIKAFLTKHIRTHTGERPYDLCKKRITEETDLLKRKSTHTGEKRYKCDVCQKGFTKLGILNAHNRIHTGEKPFECDICQRRFNYKQHLKRHIRLHTGDNLYKCDICQRSFNVASSFKRHSRIHLADKPFKCDVCQRSFSFAFSLKRHYLLHTGEISYKCEICQKTFTQLFSLKVHNRIHTGEKPFKCKICPKGFNKIFSLKNHIRTHTGDLYKCDICQRSFNAASSFKRHSRIHLADKPFKCDKCQRSFKTKSILDKHLRSLTCAPSKRTKSQATLVCSS